MDSRDLIHKIYYGTIIPQELSPILEPLHAINANQLAYKISQHLQVRPKMGVDVAVDSKYLCDMATQFHEKAGTLTNEVEENIAKLETNAPRLRISHQPNLFPYLGVTNQFVFLDSVSRKLKNDYNTDTAEIFVVVDFDIAGDSRFRVSHYPTVSQSDGSLVFSKAVKSAHYQKLMYTLSKPPQEVVNTWLNNLRQVLLQELNLMKRMDIPEKSLGSTMGNFRRVVDELIWPAYEYSNTLVEFNSFFLSRLVNLWWKLPFAFISGRKIHYQAHRAFDYIINNNSLINDLSDICLDLLKAHDINIHSDSISSKQSFPFWSSCPQCEIRISLTRSTVTPLVVIGNCTSCNKEYSFSLEDISKPGVGVEQIRFSPRILADNLLDVIGIRTAGSSGYIGQAEHLLISNYILHKLEWKIPPASIWRPRGIYYSAAECISIKSLESIADGGHISRVRRALQLSFSGKASILYYLICRGGEGFYELWKDYYDGDGHVSEINDGFANAPLIIPDKFKQNMLSVIASQD